METGYVTFNKASEDEVLRRLDRFAETSPVHAAISDSEPEVLALIATMEGHVDITGEGGLLALSAAGKRATDILDLGMRFLDAHQAGWSAKFTETGNSAVQSNGEAVADEIVKVVAASFAAVFDFNPGGAH